MTDLTEQAKPTVMVRENLSAYYFSFETTGNQDIDRILGAIAWAGKAYHHTEDWDDDDLGLSCVDNIQNAANLAATTLETLTQENARLREAGWRGIESAPGPTDEFSFYGPLILVWDGENVSAAKKDRTGSFTDLELVEQDGDWMSIFPNPTHWMPLPPAPAHKALGGGDEK